MGIEQTGIVATYCRNCVSELPLPKGRGLLVKGRGENIEEKMDLKIQKLLGKYPIKDFVEEKEACKMIG